MPRRLTPVLLAAALGCAAAEKIGREVARQTPGGRAMLGQWDRYSKLAHVLKKYHDSGALSQDDVMSVLYGAGVIKKPMTIPPLPPGAPAPKTPPKAPPKADPFPVPTYKGAWRWPLEAGVVSSEYGRRWGKDHHGIDIAADMRMPVYAVGPGKVLYAGDRLRGYGNVVMIRHDENTVTLYAHNDSIKVKEQAAVKANQVIALLGSTGKSTGPHVHFEFRVGNGSVDPRKMLPKSRF
ncbi:MAG: M23 family metallopeptidase [Elusimicrobia bacterium]|nr:M23 family metallopeptidase [Elusimicrobiota bacterium]